MGQKNKPSIKLFVAHTAGRENAVIENPLFLNVSGGY